ncbi:hypothetical protein BCV64_04385 [Cylindrospermopsis raciborskii MVCC14]|nr:hypothetical protein BCV64_04385 [Cylindrospermopsis raciborskii MVCC14]
MTLILALDFGGTKLAAGTVEAGSREWLRRESQLSPKNGDGLNDVEIMRSLINAVLDNRRPDAIGVSFGGPNVYYFSFAPLIHNLSLFF